MDKPRVSVVTEDLNNLLYAVRAVIGRWERGDLAEAVRELAMAYVQLTGSPAKPVPRG